VNAQTEREERMMNCPTCDRSVPADAKYCIYCAAQLQPDAPPTVEQPVTGPTVRLGPTPSYHLPSAAPVPPPAPIPAVPQHMAPRRKRRRSNDISGPVFFFGLVALFLTKSFWPGILLLLGITAFLSESAKGKPNDALQGLIFFGGLALLFWGGFFWPGILFLIGAMMLLSGGKRHGWRC
jgi:hypothetical protein